MLSSLISKVKHNIIFIVKHKLLPRRLLARSMTILVFPIVVSLLILGYIFYNNHWGIVGKRLARSITGEISATILLLEETSNPAEQMALLKTLSDNFYMDLSVLPNTKLSPDMNKTEQNWTTSEFKEALSIIINYKYYIDEISQSPSIIAYIQYNPNDILKVTVPYKRFFSSTAYVFVLWMIVTFLLFLGISALFMKNQIRSIIKLTQAAEEFGKGRNVDFRIGGASEIKKAGRAFLNMKSRINRHLSERTYMLAGVSHDLRTPLTRMNLQLALLENESNADFVNGIRLDVKVMENMIDAYIAFVKGEGAEPFTLVSLPNLLKDAINRFEASSHNIDLIINDDFSMNIRQNAIIRCINNIVGNATRYAEKINVELHLDQHKFAVITIDDDGPGIDEDKFEEVFRAFYRVESSRNLKTGGIGLGLTVSKDIINAHGGEIILAKSPLGGLQVIIRLPI